MLGKISKNKPLAWAVLILVSSALVFHDYFLIPSKKVIERIPEWTIEQESVEFSRTDPELFLGQVAWLVGSLERRAALEQDLRLELRHLKAAREALTSVTSCFEGRVAAVEGGLAGRSVSDSLSSRHRHAVDGIRHDLKALSQGLSDLESHSEIYDRLSNNPYWLNELRLNHHRSRIIKEGERLLSLIDPHGGWFGGSGAGPDSLPTASPRPDRMPRPMMVTQVGSKSPLRSVLLDVMFGGAAMAADPPLADDLQTTKETARTEVIVNLAAELNHDPVRIYEYVRNRIDYLPGSGSVQGAQGALLSGAGNAVDQASLLIALLRESGIPARYVSGRISVPVEKVKGWIGASDGETSVSIFNRNGVLADLQTDKGELSTVELEHVWVRAYVSAEPHRGAGAGTSYWVDLDPSFKQYQTGPYLDVANEIGVDPFSFLVSIKDQATINEEQSWASDVPEDTIIDKLDEWADRVERYAHANDRSPEDLYRTRKIIAEHLEALPSTLPYQFVGAMTESPTLAAGQGCQVTIKLLNPDNSTALTYTTDLINIGRGRMALSYQAANSESQELLADYAQAMETPAYLIDLVPSLTLDGETVAQGSQPVTMAAEQYLSITIDGPGFLPSNAVRPVPAGSHLALIFNAQGVSTSNLYDELAALREIRDSLAAGTAPANDDALGRVLHLIGLAYFQELDRMTKIAAASMEVAAVRQPSFMTVGYEITGEKTFGVTLAAQAKRLAVSIDRNSLTAVSLAGQRVDEKQFLLAAGLTAAALEHNVLVQTTNGEAASALRLVQAASTGGTPVFTLTPDNYADLMTQAPLSDLPPEVRLHVGDAAHAGMTVVVPGAEIDYAGYHGMGYIAYDPATGANGYFIYGNLAGGVRQADFLFPADLILPGTPAGCLNLIKPALGWAALANDVTTSVAWRYSPAISAINNWFKDADHLDKVAFIAAGIAISGPIGVLTDRAEVMAFNASPQLFSPNKDGNLDLVTVTAGVSRTADWEISVTGELDTKLKSLTGQGQEINLTWDGTDNQNQPLPDGTYTINADATAVGKTIPARTQTAAVEIDNTPPELLIATPAAGAEVSGIVSVAGTAADLNLVSWTLERKCQDEQWTVLNTETEDALSQTLGWFDSELLPAGECLLRLSALDAAANQNSITVAVTNAAQGQAAPEVAFTAPAPGTVSGVVTVIVTATDDKKVEQVELLVNGVHLAYLAGTGTYTYSLNSSLFPNGTLNLIARACDERNVCAEDALALTADNEINNLAAAPQLMTPDGDGKDDTVTITASLPQDAQWTLAIAKADGTVLKNFNGTGSSLSQIWDGRDESGVIPTKAAFDCTATVTINTSTTASVGFRLETLNKPPVLALHAPAEDDSITAPTDVIATVSDSDLAWWKLEITEVKDGLTASYTESDWTTLAQGSASVVKNKIHAFDPTQMKNNPYYFRLSADDADPDNPPVSITRQIFVSGQLKIGLFTLSFEDLTVPLGGIPITIGRTYSSIERNTRGEFDYGWKMFIKDVDVREDPKRNVTVDLPGGRRVTFHYNLQTQNAVTLRAVWEAEPGVYDKLEMAGDNRVLWGEDPFTKKQKVLGFFHDYLASLEPTPYEESIVPAYNLTTRDGAVFKIERPVLSYDPLTDKPTYGKLRLTSVTDLNGNRLIYHDSGVYWGCAPGVSALNFNPSTDPASCIEKVLFTRDPAHNNRVTALTDPAGNQVIYAYDDDTDDLAKVRLQDGSSTAFIYQADHYLKDIVAPTGVRATRNEYDASGRLIAVIDPDNNRVEFTHKPNTKQEVVKDRLGNVTVFEYDDSGSVISETNALGHRTEYEYDEDGNKTKEVDALGNVNIYDYDSKGNLLSSTDALGNEARFTYDGWGNISTVTNAMGHVTRSSYDLKGQLLSLTDAMGNVRKYSYDSAGNLTSSTDPLDHTTSYTYDDKGRQKSSTDARNFTSSTEYDAAGNAWKTKDRRGFETTRTFDKRGRVLSSTDPLNKTTTYEYDAAGHTTIVKDTTDAISVAIYDQSGRVIKRIAPDLTETSTEYDAEGRVVKSIDQAGAETRTLYDAIGSVIKTVKPNGAETEIFYDSAVRIIQTRSDAGGVAKREYDTLGQTTSSTDALGAVTSYEYDKLGRQTAMVDANGHRWGREYDANGRMTAMVYPDGTRSAVEFDATGRTIANINQAGIRTEYLYDESGNLVGVNDAAGGEVKYSYDAERNLITIEDTNHNVTTFTYDTVGRKLTRTLPEGMTEQWVYNDCCQAAEYWDFNTLMKGESTPTVTYEYNLMKRETMRQYKDGKSIGRLYNSRGQIAHVVYNGYEFGPDSPYQDRVFTYDSLTGKLLRDKKEDGQFIAYKYDIRGNLIETSFSGGHVLSYSYDVLNRLESVTDSNGTTHYTYDDVGNRRSVAYPNQTITQYDYNSLNRLIYLENSGPNGLISNHRNTLDPTGNRLQVIELYRDSDDEQGNPSPVVEEVRAYQYDRHNRLIRESLTGAHAYWIAYQYDTFGNRLEQNSGGEVTAYAYDANDRLLAESSPIGDVAYTWDYNGNLSGKNISNLVTGVTEWTYQWNLENKLIRAEKNNSLVSGYAYDFQGERIYDYTDSGATQYLMDINNRTGFSQAIREIDDSKHEITTYTYGDDLIDQQKEISGYSSTTLFFHYDGIGSTRALTSVASGIKGDFLYQAFGDLLNNSEDNITRHLFTGEAFDSQLGSYYLRSRNYAPKSGRFISMDSFSSMELSNRYVYSSNNPVLLIDYSGCYGEDVHTTLTTELCNSVCNAGSYCSEIAKGDQGADAGPPVGPIPTHANQLNAFNHGTNLENSTRLMDTYITSMMLKTKTKRHYFQFGHYLHLVQDSHSHCEKQYNMSAGSDRSACWHNIPPENIRYEREGSWWRSFPRCGCKMNEAGCKPQWAIPWPLPDSRPLKTSDCHPDKFVCPGGAATYNDEWAQVDCAMYKITKNYLRRWCGADGKPTLSSYGSYNIDVSTAILTRGF